MHHVGWVNNLSFDEKHKFFLEGIIYFLTSPRQKNSQDKARALPLSALFDTIFIK